ncbi:MAG: response regulator [Candidatus Spechtbacterales bacterium]
MKKVLFIEDEPVLQETLAEALHEAGFEVALAADGEKGLELILANEYDLILLDLILPRRNGFQIMEALKKEGRIPKAPIVVLTNLESAHDVERVLALGATTYLVKAHYTPSDIVQKIRQMLEKETWD